MKILIPLVLVLLLSCSNNNLYAQAKIGDIGISVAVNSIQGQIGVPIMAGSGSVLVDADGNIVALGGDRTDNSYSFSILPKYFIKNDILLRFEFGITNLNLKANVDQLLPSIHNIQHLEVTNKIFRYTPGFQWFFMKEKRIESYFGLTVSYINYRSVSSRSYFQQRERVMDTLQVWVRSNDVIPGGFALGVGSLAGFSIYLHKKISLGAELSSSALYYKFGGITASEATAQVLPNPAYSEYDTYINSYKGFRISKIISSFNITIWL